MSKYAQFVLVIIYGFVTATAVYILLFLLANGRLDLSDWIVFAIIAGWLLICLTAVYWFTDILLFFSQVRKPVYEEQQRLILSLHKVQKNANDRRQYRLYVAETNDLGAYAIGYHTVVISKACIKYLTENELSAVLAHEIGHLRTKDCMAVMAFYFANLLPGFVSYVFSLGLIFLKRYFVAVVRIGLLTAIVLLIVLLFLLAKTDILMYLLPIISFVALLWLFNKIFSFLWLLNMRYTEYRQDAFAQKLGFGIEIKNALLKIVESGSLQRVDQYSVITGATHPIVYNRIRRLEKLEGLRK